VKEVDQKPGAAERSSKAKKSRESSFGALISAFVAVFLLARYFLGRPAPKRQAPVPYGTSPFRSRLDQVVGQKPAVAPSPPQVTRPQPAVSSLSPGLLSPIALVLILAFAFTLRFWGVNWDSYTHLHPDERFITMVESDLRIPNSIGQYFDSAKSPMSPYNTSTGANGYAYGTFPLFLTKVTGEVLDHQNFFPLNLVKGGLEKAFTGEVVHWNDYDHIDLIGRLWSAIFATGTVLVVFLTGKLLYNRRAGLLAAFLMATSVLDIQLAHFFTVDSFLTFFSALTIYYCVRIVKFGRWSDFALAGLGLGFATACKLSGAFLAPIILLAAVWRLRKLLFDILWRLPTTAHLDENEEMALVARPALGLLLAAVAAFVVFRVAEPYAFNGPHIWDISPSQKYLDDMRNLIGLQQGGNVPFNWEWVGRTPYLFPLQNIVLWGMGLPLGLAACGAFVWALWRLFWKHDSIDFLLLAWIAFYFVFWGKQFNLTARYFLPLYPALVLLAAHGMQSLWRFAISAGFRSFLRRWAVRLELYAPLALRGGVACVVVGTAAWALAFTNIYRRPLTRVEASEWMLNNLPAQSVVTHEVWDDGLPFNVPGHVVKSIAGCSPATQCTAAPGTEPADIYVLDVEPYGYDLSNPNNTLLDGLNRADYIALSSNRLYASIPRAPAKWPETTKFYDLLLADKLPGFHLLKSLTSYPTLFGISINDDMAEGNFTVYDHPKVLLYKKTSDYSPEKLMAAVSDVCSQAAVTDLAPASAAQNALQLSPSDCVTQRAGGTWTSIFNPTSLSNRFPAITWLLAVEIMSLALLPMAFSLFRALPDRGYLLTKPLGLLTVSWLVWMGTSLKVFHFERLSILGIVALVLVAGAVVARFTRGDIVGYFQRHWRRILLSEVLFIGAFLVFYWIRSLDPDLWHPARGGEKPMDLAYLNAVVRSTTMPPYDPWFAGGYLNYYYFGQFMTATLVKLTGILPEIAFNLAVPLFFAMTVGAAFSVVYNLAEATRKRIRWRPGFQRINRNGPFMAALGGAVLLAVIGNLQGVVETAQRFARVVGDHPGQGMFFVSGLIEIVSGAWKVASTGAHLVPFDYWAPSRMMPPQLSITEFPFFSFLFADLHAHVMAIPFDIAILGVSLSLVLGDRQALPQTGARQVRSWLVVVALALLIGALRPINSWDYPPFLVIGIAAIFIGEWAVDRRMNWRVARGAAGKAVVLILLSIIFFYPFWHEYHLFYKGFHAVSLNQQDKTTPLHQYLAHFGILLFACGGLVGGLAWRFFRRQTQPKIMIYVGTIAAILVLLVLAMAVSGQSKHLPITFEGLSASGFLGDLLSNNIPVVAFSIVFIALLAVLAWREIQSRRPDSGVRLFLFTMMAIALALSAMVDIITLDGDIERMNTVFKFYIHVWLLLALTGAFGIWYVMGVLRRHSKQASEPPAHNLITAPKAGWAIVLVVLVGGGLIYPIAGTRARVDTSERFPQYQGHTNDGMDYMQYAVYNDETGTMALTYDYQAIQWMRENVKGSPVIVEGSSPEYRWSARFSIYTGLPTVIGWGWHEKQQRGEFEYMVTERENDLTQFYSSPDTSVADDFLRKYQVQYVIVGQLERDYYSQEGIAKFAQMSGHELDLVYQNDQTQIYKVVNLPAPATVTAVSAQ
jgi:YYY domain-containing protein